MKRTLPAIILTLLLTLGVYALYTITTGNFHEIVDGQAYRSAQLTPVELSKKVSRYGFASVLNLRGPNADKDWYQQEIAFCNTRGIEHYDITLSAGKDISTAQSEEIVSIMKSAPKPILIHCRNGADRAAFGAALYELAIANESAEEASEEMTMWYGHIPFITPHVGAMDRSFWAYADILNKKKKSEVD